MKYISNTPCVIFFMILCDFYGRGPQLMGRSPVPGHGRVATGSQERSGKNVYWYDTLLFIVHYSLFIYIYMSISVCCMGLLGSSNLKILCKLNVQ